MDGLLVEPSFVLFVPVITGRDETSVVVHDPQQMRFYLFGPFVFIPTEGSRDYWKYMCLRLGSSSCACHPCDQDGYSDLLLSFSVSPLCHRLCFAPVL